MKNWRRRGGCWRMVARWKSGDRGLDRDVPPVQIARSIIQPRMQKPCKVRRVVNRGAVEKQRVRFNAISSRLFRSFPANPSDFSLQLRAIDEKNNQADYFPLVSSEFTLYLHFSMMERVRLDKLDEQLAGIRREFVSFSRFRLLFETLLSDWSLDPKLISPYLILPAILFIHIRQRDDSCNNNWRVNLVWVFE